MKVALKFITSSVEALKELSSLKFKAKQAFQIAKLIKSAQSELEAYEPIRNACVRKYSSDGQKVDPERIHEFAFEMNEILDEEVEISDCHLTEADFEDFTVSANHLFQLEWLIKKE